MKKIISLLTIVFFVGFLTNVNGQVNPKVAEQGKHPKNIILMIGDGMGPVYLAGYRYYRDDLTTKAVEDTIYDQLWLGMASSYPDDDTYVTDSAAGRDVGHGQSHVRARRLTKTIRTISGGPRHRRSRRAGRPSRCAPVLRHRHRWPP